MLFSPVTTATGGTGSGLGPMAVVPEHQRCGIGAALMEAGLARMRAAGCPFVVVLGHHEYYTRFGFVPASRYGLRCEWDVPDESFMVHVLDAAATGAAAGLIRYRPEFVMEMPG
jgi:putative acetyltransferase